MKRERVKLFSLVLSLFLISVMITGCASSGNSDDSGTTTLTEESTAAVETSAATDSAAVSNEGMSTLPEIEFTYFVPDPARKVSTYEAPIIKNVFEKTKVHIKFVIPAGDATEKLNIMLASGDYPDAISFGGNDAVMMNKYIDSGKIIPLDDLLASDGKDLVNNLGPIVKRIKSEKDKKIYYLPEGYRVDGIENFPESSGNMTQIRSSYLEKKNWFKPTTLEEYANFLKEIKASDPKVIPASIALNGKTELQNVFNSAIGAFGLTASDSLIKNADGSLFYQAKAPEVKKFFGWLNKLYLDGLLDKEAPLNTNALLKSKASSRKIASEINGDSWEVDKVLTETNSNELFIRFWLKGDSSIQKTSYAPYSVTYPTGYCITDKCKDPARFMKFVNWFSTEDGRMTSGGIINYDGEDKDGYDWYVKDGKVYPTKYQGVMLGSDENWWVKEGLWQFNFSPAMSNVKGSIYDWTAMEADVSNWWDDLSKKINGSLGIKGTDYFPNQMAMSVDVSDFRGLAIAPESDENMAFVKIEDYVMKTIPKLVVAKSEAEFISGYDAMLKKIDEMGIAKWEKVMNDLHSKRLESWK